MHEFIHGEPSLFPNAASLDQGNYRYPAAETGCANHCESCEYLPERDLRFTVHGEFIAGTTLPGKEKGSQNLVIRITENLYNPENCVYSRKGHKEIQLQ
jgi:hypothetical protein